EDLQSLGGAAQAVDRKCVSHGAIYVVWRAIVSVLGEILRLLCVLIDVEPETGEVRCDRGFVRRAFVQTLEHFIKFPQLVVRTIDFVECIERLAPCRWISGN